MPRIAHVISSPSGVGGAERVLAALVEDGVRRGWDQIVLNPFAGDPPNDALASLLAPDSYQAHPCSGPTGLVPTRRWLVRQIAEFAPSILHAHLVHAIIGVGSLRRQPHIRSVATYHHGDHLLRVGRRGLALLDRAAGRRFDRAVAVSEATRAFLLQRYGYAPEHVECIHNGWSGTPRPPSRTGRRPTVICVANLRSEKRHDVLLDAFARVVAQIPSAELVIVGEGEMRGAIDGEIARRGIQSSVRLTGAVPDVWPLLADADVFAAAPDHESFGISVVEAMAAGLPVVATAASGISGLVREGETGYLVAPGDAGRMAERICSLLGAPALAAEMGRAGAALADDYTAERMVDRYHDLYRRLLTTITISHGAGTPRA